MLLISPTRAALAIGAKCGGSAPSAEDETLQEILTLLTPRIEDMMNVDSLALGEFEDHFRVTQQEGIRLQLRNGLLTEEPITLLYGDGSPVQDEYEVDTNYGVVEIPELMQGGKIVVRYESGLKFTKAEDPRYNLVDNPPDWMVGIIEMILVRWYRNVTLAPRIPKEVSLYALQTALNREVYTALYSRYQRPRYGVLFPSHRANVD